MAGPPGMVDVDVLNYSYVRLAPSKSSCFNDQGRVEDAEKVLKWLRGPGFDVTPELQALKKAQVSVTIQCIL